MKNSSGEVIAFLDSDDQWVEKHLYNSIEALLKEKVSVCFALWYEQNKKGEIIKRFEDGFEKERLDEAVELLKPRINGNRYVFSSPEFYEYTTGNKSIYCYHINTMIFKRDILKSVQMLNEKLWAAEDTDFIQRIIHDYDFCLILDYHFIYNIGDESNLYAFMDRSDISLERFLGNKTFIEKLTFLRKNECIMILLRKSFIKNSTRLENKAACILRCHKKLALAYFTMGYINKDISKFRSLVYLLKSLRYRYHKKKVQLFIKILLPFTYKNLEITDRDIRIL